MNIFGYNFGLDIDDRNIDGSTFFLVLYLIIFIGFICALGCLAKEASESDSATVSSIDYSDQEPNVLFEDEKDGDE